MHCRCRQIINEYYAALSALVAPKRVGLRTLYKDNFDLCVPAVPATYVSLLPLMAVMRQWDEPGLRHAERI